MTDKPMKLDVVEQVVRIIRDAILLAGLVILICLFAPRIPGIVSRLGEVEVDQVEFMGLKFKVQEAQAALQAAVKVEAPKQGREDREVGEQTRLIADALQKLSSAGPAVSSPGNVSLQDTSFQRPSKETFWVYLGARRHTSWITRNFDIGAVPTAGTTIRSRADVFKRRSLPVFRQGEWILGDVLGVLLADRTVAVVRTESITGTENSELWWAEVSAK